MDWYYAKNGQQLGPVSKEELSGLFRSGTVIPTDLVWCESMAEWAPIGSLADFAAPPSLEAPPAMSPAPSSYVAPAATAATAAPALAPASASGQPEPPTYLWQSIVVMLLCCIPLGISALVFSTKVKPAYAAGDYAAALEASKKAKTWCIIALVVGLVVQTLYILLNVGLVMSEVSKNGGL